MEKNEKQAYCPMPQTFTFYVFSRHVLLIKQFTMLCITQLSVVCSLRNISMTLLSNTWRSLENRHSMPSRMYSTVCVRYSMVWRCSVYAFSNWLLFTDGCGTLNPITYVWHLYEGFFDILVKNVQLDWSCFSTPFLFMEMK